MSRAEGTMSILVVRALTAGASALGVPPNELATRAGLSADAFAALADPDARVPARHVVRLWEWLSEQAADRAFGLWLADLVRDAPITMATHVTLTSPTLGEGLARAVRYQRLLHDQARSELAVGPREGVYRHRVGASFRAPNAAIEFGFATIVQLARRATGRDVRPTRVSLQHAAPADRSHHERWFGPRITFGARHDEVAFSRTDLDSPLVLSDPSLREVLEAHAKFLLARLPPDDAPTTARVRAVIVEALRGEAPTLAGTAERLGVPARTLQRRLQDEGARFEALLDDARREHAVRWLTDARFAIQEIAFLLGFSDVAAFHRAFVRWTGDTPARYRATRTVNRSGV